MKQLNTNIIVFCLLLLLPGITLAGRKDKKKKKRAKQEQLSKSDEIAVQSLFIEATKAKMLEDFQEAVNKFEKVTRMDPDNAAAHYELALLFFKSKQHEVALNYIKKATEKDKENNKWYLMLEGEIYSYLNQHEKAAETYTRLLESYPQQIDYYFELAYQYIKADKYKEALETYSKVEQIIGFNESIALQKQRIYIKLDDLESAIGEIERLIETDPDNPQYYENIAELYRTNNMPEKAEETYKKILELEENSPYALFNLANLKRNDGDREAYMDYLMQVFKNPEVDVDTKVRVLFPYLSDPSTDSLKRGEALKLVKVAADLHPNSAKVFAIYGDFYYQEDKLEKALDKYQKAIENDNSVFEVWQQIFFILSELQEYNQLLDKTEKALELFPNQAIIYYFNGIALNQKKQFEEAIAILETGKDLALNNNILKAQILSTLGDAYNSLDKYGESDEAFEAALELDPENAYVMNNYSYYLSLRNENLDRAEELSLKSNELEPNTVSFQDTYGWIKYQQGDYKKAEEWIGKALENGGEDNAVILEHYGDILYKLGKEDKAVSYWKKAALAGSESENINKKIADKKLYE